MNRTNTTNTTNTTDRTNGGVRDGRGNIEPAAPAANRMPNIEWCVETLMLAETQFDPVRLSSTKFD